MIRPLLALFATLLPGTAMAQTPASCQAEETYLSAPVPAIDPEALVSRTETIVIDAPLDHVVSVVNDTDLEEAIAGQSELPHVVATRVLTGADFGAPGTRRLVCLSDDSTVLEQALVRTLSDTQYHFRYVVWNYTTPEAEAIEYGVGDFQFTVSSPDQTRIEWTYGFKLKDDTFPGNLGFIGSFLFRIGFLDGSYAEMMRATLETYRMAARP